MVRNCLTVTKLLFLNKQAASRQLKSLHNTVSMSHTPELHIFKRLEWWFIFVALSIFFGVVLDMEHNPVYTRQVLCHPCPYRLVIKALSHSETTLVGAQESQSHRRRLKCLLNS